MLSKKHADGTYDQKMVVSWSEVAIKAYSGKPYASRDRSKPGRARALPVVAGCNRPRRHRNAYKAVEPRVSSFRVSLEEDRARRRQAAFKHISCSAPEHAIMPHCCARILTVKLHTTLQRAVQYHAWIRLDTSIIKAAMVLEDPSRGSKYAICRASRVLYAHTQPTSRLHQLSTGTSCEVTPAATCKQLRSRICTKNSSSSPSRTSAAETITERKERLVPH